MRSRSELYVGITSLARCGSTMPKSLQQKHLQEGCQISF
ncbi:hypothetical protein COO91_00073 [Nostoc flagelliforme CCNUN1]|uniref:Uncharacterized protein n=1 Tax=Nostoc flagelliforme CCNUN1 TaxID=2038116 RepID=A0A2K8SFX2_9NOSO|nr:hypothetical protein COO91_00009 [Nostoc flagelliforme CCNUN1]AUB34260.1 hypothetical protein COO91_00073 [Nostoc flagelliforme CCNUN1]